jgi:hypothetical protein
MDTDSDKSFWLAVGVLFAAFAYLFYATEKFGAEFAKMIVPFLLGTAIGTIINWRWGSSKGSEQKTAIMAEESKQLAKATKEERKESTLDPATPVVAPATPVVTDKPKP